MITVEQLIDIFPHSGSSIHLKAEVTLMVDECTKDALLHNMEESVIILISLGKYPILDTKSRRPIVVINVLSYFEMVLAKLWMIFAMLSCLTIVCLSVWFYLLVEFKPVFLLAQICHLSTLVCVFNLLIEFKSFLTKFVRICVLPP